MRAIKEMFIEGLSIKEVPITHDMAHRPFEFGGDNSADVMANISELNELQGNVNGHITPGMIAKSVPTLLTVATPMGVAHIPNGYGSSRYSFILSVRITYLGDRQEILKVTGFSDNIELLSNNNAVNTAMPLYISSVMFMDIGADHSTARLDHVSNVILPDATRTSSNEMSNSALTNLEGVHSVQRPDDVWSHMLISQNSFEDGVQRLNTSDRLFSSAMYSDIINTDQFGYTSRVINSFNQSNADIDNDTNLMMGDMVDMSLYAGCHMHSQDNVITHNVFLAALQNATDNATEGTSQGVFTIHDLMTVDPTFNLDRITVFKLSNSDMHDYRNMTVNDYDISVPAEVISAVNFLVVNIMERVGVFATRVVITNMSMDASVPWLIDALDGRPMSGIPVSAVNTMISLLHNEMPGLISSLFSGGIHLEIDANLLSETVISASLEGYAKEVKAFPSYAGNTYTPIIVPPGAETNVYEGFSRVVDIIGTPIDSIDEGQYNAYEETDSAGWSEY